MAIADMDLTLQASNVELFLARPNREIVSKLSEAYNKRMVLKLGNINEINFTIPYEIDVNRKLIRNKNADIIRDRYLIKALYTGKEEWYVITNIVDSMSDEDSMDVTCYLLSYELSNTNIRTYKEDALSIYQVMNGGTIVDPNSGNSYQIDGILDRTSWTLGYVDGDIATKYRGYDFSSTNVLNAVFGVAETLNALIVWNTVTRVIEFWNADNYGIDKGFIVNYGRYLKSLSRESNGGEITTRLKVFGKDGMSIQGVNINGQNYLEDYSYFLYPFQRDGLHNVISHSDFMTDALCHAILDYTEFVQSKQGQYTTLLSQKTGYETTLATRNLELVALQEQMKVIDNNIDLSKSMQYDYSGYVTSKNAKQAEINSKTSEITSLNSSINGIVSQINTLALSLQYSVFFTPTLLDELLNFTIEREISNDIYDDESELYEFGKKEFEKIKQPQVILNIDIVNLMSIIEAQRDWSKVNLGDTITIRHEKLGIDMKAKIIEISFDFESDNINLTIANTKDILTDEEKLIKMIYSNNATSTAVGLNKSKWDGIEATTSKVEQIINNEWDAIKASITGGVDGSLVISERGLISRNTNPNNYLVIQNGVMAITNDNGNTWKHAITADGIIGERIYGKLLAGVNLTIDASDAGGTKMFTVDGTGVKILGSKLIVTGGLDESNLSATFVSRIDTSISNVQTSVDTLETNVDNMLSDAMITSIEANTLKISLAQVTSESADLVSVATTLSIATEKTNYSTALTALTTEINKWIDQASYPLAITSTDRTNIKTKFSTLQAAKSVLINKISITRQALSKTYTDDQVTQLNSAISTLDTNVDNFSSDLMITLSEANALKVNLNQVTSESTDVVSVANTLGIVTEKTNYSTSLTTLTTEINNWIDKTGYPLAITAAQRTSIKTKFEDLQNKKSVLINKIASVREQRAKDASVGLGVAYNGVVVDATNGLVITKSDNTIRTVLNATEGFSFEKKNGAAWDKKLYYNATTGNLTMDGEFNAKSIKIGGVEVIAGGKLDGDMIDSIKVQQLDASSAKITTAMIETLTVGGNVFMGANASISWSQVSNQPSIPVVPGYIQSTYIDSVSIQSPNIYGGTIAIGSGNSIFKADANGVYLGNATFASAPFKVTMGGVLSATGANISGAITASTISGSTITGSTLKTADSGTRIVMNSFLADINMYHGTNNLFQIRDDITTTTICSPSNSGINIVGTIYATGLWNFSGATVTGVTAVFG